MGNRNRLFLFLHNSRVKLSFSNCHQLVVVVLRHLELIVQNALKRKNVAAVKVELFLKDEQSNKRECQQFPLRMNHQKSL